LTTVVLVAALVVPLAPAAGLHFDTPKTDQDPVADHGDRFLVDTDGDGQETLEFSDVHSEDPDWVHDNGRETPCELHPVFAPGGGQGIWDYVWINSTDETWDSVSEWWDNYLEIGNPSDPVSFGLGTWDIALRVADRCNNSDWTNFTLEVVPNATLLHESSETFEDGWTLTGLAEETGECPEANEAYESDPPYLGFTVVGDQDCVYGTEVLPEATATLSVDLGEGLPEDETWPKVGLRYAQWWDTGRSALGDIERMTLAYSFDGGETWMGPEEGDGCGTRTNDAGPLCWDDDSAEVNTWTTREEVLDVPEETETDELLLRWHFEATSTEDIDASGWFLDDVEVFGLAAEEG
jgi:hypothetical protein